MQDIHLAAWNGDYEEFQRLLFQSPGLANAKDSFQRTPLHYAAQSNRDQMVKLLLERGANVNAKDKHNRTPLIEAASTGSCKVIEQLIYAGADTRTKDNIEGRTALLWAAYHLQPGAISALIDEGADSQVRDKNGLNILHLMAVTPALEGQDQASGRKEFARQLNRLVGIFGETRIKQMLAASSSDGNRADYLLHNNGVVYVRGYSRSNGPVRPYFRRLPR